MRWWTLAMPLVAVAALASVALRMEMAPALAAVGFDPLFGFMLSPVPLLRFAAVLQLVGSAVSAVGGLAAIFWRRG